MNSGVFQIGEVIFDQGSRSLTLRDGRPLPLRNKSKEVLLQLLQHANATVTKQELLDSVWSDVTVGDDSLVQCIADIRRAIGADARNIVETIPRTGYRINIRSAPSQGGRKPRLWAGLAVALGLAWVGAYLLWPTNQPPEPALQVVDAKSVPEPPGTSSTQAYLEVLQGRASVQRLGVGESLVAERHFRKAIDLDPNYAAAYAELGGVLAIRFENDWSVLQEADRQKALFFAERAVELDPELWQAHYAIGRVRSILGDHDQAKSHLRRALELKPDAEDARAYLGVVHNFGGDPQTAIEILEQAVTSHPDPPFWYHFALGHAFFNVQRYVEAESQLTECLRLADRSPYCLRYMIGLKGVTADTDGAGAAIAAYSSTGFDASVKAIIELMPFHHPDDLDHLEWGLRRAGLPD